MLGHRRLSIIDLSSAGRQPMRDQQTGTWLTYNGEIYNYRELREELLSHGVKFRSKTDSEVLLHAYRIWGLKCVEKLRGMFAFAIWDPALERLVLGRDRIGKKPLFYYQGNHSFMFTSELKALLAVPGFERQINPAAIHDYLTFGYVPGEQSIFQNVHKVPPGHLVIWEHGELRKESYWDPSSWFSRTGDSRLSEKAWCDDTRDCLEECVKARLVSDVPVGAFLSGGIDSSAIVAFMARQMGDRVKTFSIGFRENSFNELKYARMVARHFKTDHHEYIVEPQAADLLPDLVWHLDEPFADASILPTYLLAQLAREHVKVVLTGDGGDESFAGYESYLAEQYVEFYGKIPRLVRRAIEAILSPMPESSSRNAVLRRAKRFVEKAAMLPERREWRMIFPNAVKAALYSPEMQASFNGADSLERRVKSFEEHAGVDWIRRLQLWDLEVYLPDDLMVKVDRATMAHGLEARSPFLDHTLIERVAEMPSGLKVHGLTTKYILKKAVKELLPPGIVHRSKQGFAVPVSHWLRGELREMAEDVLLSASSIGRGYFRRKSVEDLLQAHMGGVTDHGYKLWALVNLELWHQRFLDSPATLPSVFREPMETTSP